MWDQKFYNTANKLSVYFDSFSILVLKLKIISFVDVNESDVEADILEQVNYQSLVIRCLLMNLFSCALVCNKSMAGYKSYAGVW